MTALVSRRRILQLSVVAGVAASAGAGQVLLAPGVGRRVLSGGEMDIVRAVAEVMFPAGNFPVDGLTANVAEGVDQLLHEQFPAVHVAGFRAVLRGLEWGTFVSRGAPFSALSSEERSEVLTVWTTPAVLTRRVASDALKVILGMVYFAHPDVLSFIGYRATCNGGSA